MAPKDFLNTTFDNSQVDLMGLFKKLDYPMNTSTATLSLQDIQPVIRPAFRKDFNNYVNNLMIGVPSLKSLKIRVDTSNYELREPQNSRTWN